MPLSAATYFIDVSAGSDANVGTATNTAWAHLPGSVGITTGNGGWVVLGSGDTACVKGGTTNSVQVKFGQGNYGNNNVFDAVQVISGHLRSPQWGTTRAIFDEGNTNTYGFWLASVSGMTLDGFEVRNIKAGAAGAGFDDTVGSSCILVGGATPAKSCKIRRCYLHDANRTIDDTGHGIETDGSSGTTNLVIEMNTIGPAIGTKGVEIDRLDYAVVRQNFITGTGDHGITLTGNHCDVNGNVISMTPPYVHEPVFGIKVNFNYNDIWNNLVYQAPQTSGSLTKNMEGIGTLDNASFNRFYHNTVINASDLNGNRTGAGLSLGDENAAGTNNLVANCIFAFCQNNVSSDWNTIQVYLGSASVSNQVRYCCLWQTIVTANMIARNTGSGYTFYTTAGAMAASPIGTANVFANLQQLNPGFDGGILPTGLDASFHPNTAYFLGASAPPSLRATANALSGGGGIGYDSSATKFNTDIVGTTRTLWSMGAYETTVPGVPAPPRNLLISIIGH